MKNPNDPNGDKCPGCYKMVWVEDYICPVCGNYYQEPNPPLKKSKGKQVTKSDCIGCKWAKWKMTKHNPPRINTTYVGRCINIISEVELRQNIPEALLVENNKHILKMLKRFEKGISIHAEYPLTCLMREDK